MSTSAKFFAVHVNTPVFKNFTAKNFAPFYYKKSDVLLITLGSLKG
jgi:hypothetical protein